MPVLSILKRFQPNKSRDTNTTRKSLTNAKDTPKNTNDFVLINNPSSAWIRGNPAVIQWCVVDFSVDYLCIELCQLGSEATTVVVPWTKNTGFFYYKKVPWGMMVGHDYYLRVTTLDKDSQEQPIEKRHVAYSHLFSIIN